MAYPARRTTAAALLLAAALSACGGGNDPAPCATTHSTAASGSDDTGSAALVMVLPGPVLELTAPQRVHVQLAGQMSVSAHYEAVAAATVRLVAPVATGESALAVPLPAAAPVSVAYDVWLQLPAGAHRVDAELALRATDGNGVKTGALARAVAAVDWCVQQQ